MYIRIERAYIPDREFFEVTCQTEVICQSCLVMLLPSFTTRAAAAPYVHSCSILPCLLATHLRPTLSILPETREARKGADSRDRMEQAMERGNAILARLERTSFGQWLTYPGPGVIWTA